MNIEKNTIINNLHRLINQTYKLLPLREEGGDWRKPLETTTIEVLGLAQLLTDNQELLFSAAAKLTGLLQVSSLQLSQEEEFLLYRRTIFECLNLMSQVKILCQDQNI